MGVKIEKNFQASHPVDVVWNFLSDPRKVVTCVPGAKITEQIDDRTFKGAISVKVGPSVTDFKGEAQIVRLDPVAHEIELLGKGQDTRGRGSASLKLTGTLRAMDGGGTEVRTVAELNVAGILAQMGGRVMQEVSNIMFEQFTKNFREKLNSGASAAAAGEPKPISAVGLAFSAIKASVKGKQSSSETKTESGAKPGDPIKEA
jgi:carbon monoxide dehydrogenase subunit G